MVGMNPFQQTILVVTIDTEEDNWGSLTRTEQSFENIKRLPMLQEVFDKYSIKPAYLATYPVVSDDESSRILANLIKCGGEVGIHCHPWNTPPFEEELNEKNSMLCNLSSELQYKKVKVLKEAIKEKLGIDGKVFRAGRWGYNESVADNLMRLNIAVDTSLIPLTDWTEYQGPDFSLNLSAPFRSASKWLVDAASRRESNGCLVEVPVTVAFLQRNDLFCSRIQKMLGWRGLRHFRLRGLLHATHLLRKVWLSPEVTDGKSMIGLVKVMVLKKDCRILNLFFHSTALKAGLSPFVKTHDAEKTFLQRLDEFLAFAQHAGIRSIKLSDTPQYV